MNKLLVAAAAAFLATQAVHAEVVDFNEVTSSFQSTGTGTFTSGSLTFTGSPSFLGVWTTAPTSGAYDGTPYLLDGFRDAFTVTATGGGAFTLDSFQAALGWYTGLGNADVTVTYTLAGGGTSTVTYDVTGAYATFAPGLSVTSAKFDLAQLTDGYISLDNLTINATAAVPEPTNTALMLAGLGLAGVAMRRRQARRG